jgi:hypothetical protein
MLVCCGIRVNSALGAWTGKRTAVVVAPVNNSQRPGIAILAAAAVVVVVAEGASTKPSSVPNL